MTSLNPVLRIARQLVETMRAHGRFDEEEATTRAVSLLGRMGITAPERAINSYPHQFSGGMRQRVMLAMGFANEPALLIADEPTTALDVTIQAQILDLIVRAQPRLRRGDHSHQPRARRDRQRVPARHRDVCGRGGGGGADRAGAGRSAPSLYLGADQCGAAHRPASSGRRAASPPSRARRPIRSRSRPAAASRRAVRSASPKCDEHPALLELAPGRKARCWVTQSGEPLPPPATALPASARDGRHANRVHASRDRRAAAVGARPGEALPAAARRLLRRQESRARGRRRRSRRGGGRDRRPRRRVRLRQVDLRAPRRAHPRADRRLDPLRRTGDRRAPPPPRSGRCAAACRWCSRTLTRRSIRA